MGRYESKIGLEGNSGGIEPRFCITCGSTCKGSCSGECKTVVQLLVHRIVLVHVKMDAIKAMLRDLHFPKDDRFF